MHKDKRFLILCVRVCVCVCVCGKGWEGWEWELFLVSGKVRNINNYKDRGSTCTVSSDS